MRLIGISGKRGSGKDTAAGIIAELDPAANWRVIKFADKLKQVAALLTGEDVATMYSQKGKAKVLPGWGMTVGEFQQRLGTEAIRNGLNDNAWVLALFGGLNSHGSYLITDVRFPNEADEIRQRGGLLVRLNGNPVGLQGDGARDDNHASETALDGYDFDVVIENNADLEALRARLVEVLHQADILAPY